MLGRRGDNSVVGQARARDKKLWHEDAERCNGYHKHEGPTPARRHDTNGSGSAAQKLRGTDAPSRHSMVTSSDVSESRLDVLREKVEIQAIGIQWIHRDETKPFPP